MALRWLDVDLGTGRIVVRRSVSRGVVGTPKNGRTREVPLSKQAVEALRIQTRRSQLVSSAPEGSMLTKGATKWPLWRACRQAELRRIGWHVARHTFASHLVMHGVPIRTVQELLGHSSIEMTMRYAHLSPDARREAVELLDVKERVTLVWRMSNGTELRFPLSGTPNATSYGARRASRRRRFSTTFRNRSIAAATPVALPCSRGSTIPSPSGCQVAAHTRHMKLPRM